MMDDLIAMRGELAEIKVLLLRIVRSRPLEESLRLLTISEAAKLLSYKTTSLHAMVARGDIPSVRIGEKGQRRIPAAALRAFIEQQTAISER